MGSEGTPCHLTFVVDFKDEHIVVGVSISLDEVVILRRGKLFVNVLLGEL